MGSVAIQKQATLPAPLSRELSTVLGIAHNGMHGGEIPKSHALQPIERRALEDRLATVRDVLRPAPVSEIVKALASVFVALQHRTDDGFDSRTRAGVYAGILSDLPAFAVRLACDDFCKGKAGDKKWAPSAPEIAAVAKRHAAPWIYERDRIEAALTAKVVEAVDYEKRPDTVAKIRQQWGLGELCGSIVSTGERN